MYLKRYAMDGISPFVAVDTCLRVGTKRCYINGPFCKDDLS